MLSARNLGRVLHGPADAAEENPVCPSPTGIQIWAPCEGSGVEQLG